MQLRRALPLSLVALLASAGCVSVGGPRGADVPARDSVTPADAPELTGPADASPTAGPAGLPAQSLPLGELPAPAGADRDGGGPAPSRRAAKAPRPAAERRAKPTAPRRAHPPKTPAARPERPARGPVPPLARTDELCAAAEGALPPSIVDLCIRQAGR
ncbi:hypothetical protein [Streptomyces sp. NBC_01264]|uniref:hypothetical protein n=1 Tax=Streptomyces sp. NBC_01264 TaxID=2903804 RepID=UPI00225165B8|nr:hypothetical protein [Streptomyces sp. NBC_01264]MCX4776310.1 hypothetical protein [Streptomyces sp. NBC_01264]